MPGEKQNNLSQKLNALQTVPPGFSFDKEAAWTKLEAQLHEKNKSQYSRRRTMIIMAAILLTASLSGWFTFSKHTTTSKAVSTSPALRQHPVSQPPSIRSAATTKTQAEPKTKTPVASKLKRQVVIPQPGKDPIKLPAEVMMEAAPQTQPQPAQNDSMATKPAATIKPRFRVAHINELSNPPPQPAAETRPLALLRRLPMVEESSTPAYQSAFKKRTTTYSLTSH